MIIMSVPNAAEIHAKYADEANPVAAEVGLLGELGEAAGDATWAKTVIASFMFPVVQ